MTTATTRIRYQEHTPWLIREACQRARTFATTPRDVFLRMLAGSQRRQVVARIGEINAWLERGGYERIDVEQDQGTARAGERAGR